MKALKSLVFSVISIATLISFSSCKASPEYVEKAPSIFCVWEDTDESFPAIYDIKDDSLSASIYLQSISSEIQLSSELSSTESTIQLTNIQISVDDGKTWESAKDNILYSSILASYGFNATSTTFEYTLKSNILELTTPNGSKTRTLKYRPLFNNWTQELNENANLTYHFKTNHTVEMSFYSLGTTFILKGKFTTTEKQITIKDIKYYGNKGWESPNQLIEILLKQYGITSTDTTYNYKVKNGKLFLTMDGNSDSAKLLPVTERPLTSYYWDYVTYNNTDSLEIIFIKDYSSLISAKSENITSLTNFACDYSMTNSQVTLSNIIKISLDSELKEIRTKINDDEDLKDILVSPFGISDPVTYDYFIFNNILTLCTYDETNEKAIKLCFQ